MLSQRDKDLFELFLITGVGAELVFLCESFSLFLTPLTLKVRHRRLNSTSAERKLLILNIKTPPSAALRCLEILRIVSLFGCASSGQRAQVTQVDVDEDADTLWVESHVV